MASGAFTVTFFIGNLSNFAIVFFGSSGAFNLMARFALSKLFLTSSSERPFRPYSLVNFYPSNSRASPTAVTPSFGANSLSILD